MSALALTFRDLSNTLSRAAEVPGEGQRRLADAMALYGNEAAPDRDWSLEAYEAGRPAFWTSASYHQQLACCLCNSVNLGSTLDDALDETYRRRTEAERLAGLDRLVPLNMAAAQVLVDAYSRMGLWRDEEELLMRRLRDCRRAA